MGLYGLPGGVYAPPMSPTIGRSGVRLWCGVILGYQQEDQRTLFVKYVVYIKKEKIIKMVLQERVRQAGEGYHGINILEMWLVYSATN